MTVNEKDAPEPAVDEAARRENRWAMGAFWAFAAGMGFCFLVSAGTDYLEYQERGRFSIWRFEVLSAAALFIFLAPAALVTFLFTRARRRWVRVACAAVAILAPGIFWLMVGGGGGFTALYASIPAMPIMIFSVLGAMLTGAMHSGEWWDEHLAVVLYGAIMLWSLSWVRMPVGWLAKARQGAARADADAGDQ